MRLAFAGTPAFAEQALAALLAAGHEVALVLTRPDRPAGRGLKPAASPVKRLALARGLALAQPASLMDEQALAPLAAARPEILVVAAYGQLLPRAVLAIPPRGAINIHASLLPRWRGAAPIQRALLAGDAETGISIMQMDEGLDTGPVLARHRLAVRRDDDAQTLHDRLAALGARAVIEALDDIEAGRARPVAQPRAGISYARKLEKHELEIDWTRACEELERTVRALCPAPGARTLLRGVPLKLWRARCGEGRGAPGEVLAADAAGLRIACGDGALVVSELQRAGGGRLAAAEFLRGFALSPGERLGAAR
ncbi:MAG TPA: methionyl-tRNA formyltransferase [Burkholderiales bacterium]|nr:methionyl-tRNA formyltransferase [Burkholderiales bacterium]